LNWIGYGERKRMIKKDQIKLVCERLLKEHLELRKFMSGFKNAGPCPCTYCVAARELLEEKKKK
jgi:hypothetical protein